jgi:hypothetical protein
MRAIALLLLVALPAVAQRPLKVLISVDMEGVTGAVTGDQVRVPAVP